MKTADAAWAFRLLNVVALYCSGSIGGVGRSAAGVVPAILTLSAPPARRQNDFLWKTTWTLGAIWLALVVYRCRKGPSMRLVAEPVLSRVLCN
jgi:hypothetical protein